MNEDALKLEVLGPNCRYRINLDLRVFTCLEMPVKPPPRDDMASVRCVRRSKDKEVMIKEQLIFPGRERKTLRVYFSGRGGSSGAD